jgi:hypothetical protein
MIKSLYKLFYTKSLCLSSPPLIVIEKSLLAADGSHSIYFGARTASKDDGMFKSGKQTPRHAEYLGSSDFRNLDRIVEKSFMEKVQYRAQKVELANWENWNTFRHSF